MKSTRKLLHFIFQPRVALLFLLAGLAPYFYISQYIHPAGDDLTYSAAGRDHSLPAVYLAELWGHNGRYFSNVLVFIDPMAFQSLFFYKLCPVVLIVLLILPFFIFFRTAFFSGSVETAKLLALSLLLVLVFLSLMPDLPEGIYWYTGAVSYTAAYFFVLLYASLAFSFYRARFIFRRRGLHRTALILCLFMLCGFNEVLTAIAVEAHLFALIYFYWSTKKISRELLLYFLSSIIFLLFMFLSPGNSGRAELYPEKYQVFNSILMSLLQTLRFGADWLSSAPLWLFGIVLLPQLVRTLEKKQAHALLNIHPLFILGVLATFLFTSALLPYLGTGILGQHRTINTAWFFFLCGWLWLMASAAVRLQPHAGIIRLMYDRSHLYLKAVLWISLVFSGNSFAVWNDLYTGSAKAFDMEMTARNKLLENCAAANEPVCSVPFLRSKPASIFVYDIQPGTGHWLNQGYAVYYGKPEMLVLGE